MMEIDFTGYKSFSSCPAWWRNFVDEVCVGLSVINTGPRNRAIDKALRSHNAKIIDSNSEDIDYLVFDDEIDFLAFKLKYAV